MFDYLLLGLVVAYFAWRVLNPILIRRRLPALLKDGAQVVDVRSLAEFASGHAAGSVNIPLAEIGARPGAGSEPAGDRVLCVRHAQCARGAPSARARVQEGSERGFLAQSAVIDPQRG
jgi:rhodanese-related sulfurtransferase